MSQSAKTQETLKSKNPQKIKKAINLGKDRKRPQFELRPRLPTVTISWSIPQAGIHSPIKGQLIKVLDIFQGIKRQLFQIELWVGQCFDLG